MIFRLLLVHLLLCHTLSASAATPWYVDSEFQQNVVQRYLEHLWPDHPFSVVIGPHKSRGVWYRNGALTLSTGNETVKETMIWDAVQMIGVAREWHTAAKVEDTGWAPEVTNAPSLVPVPKPRTTVTAAKAPPFPTPIQLQIGINGHIGTVATNSPPSANVAVMFPFYLRAFRLGPLIGLDLFRRKTIDPIGFEPTILWIHQLDLGLFSAWAPNQRMELTARAGCRIYSSGWQTSYSQTRSPFIPAATFGLGTRVWLHNAKRFRFGLHTSFSVDLRASGIFIGGTPHTPFQVRGGLVSQFGKNKKD